VTIAKRWAGRKKRCQTGYCDHEKGRGNVGKKRRPGEKKEPDRRHEGSQKGSGLERSPVADEGML